MARARSGVIVVLLAAGALAPASPSAAQQAEPPEVEYLNPVEGPERPFSEAVRVGSMLYLSGEIGIDPVTGELVPGGIQPETRQTMENIEATLERYGSSMDRVVKCTAMLADIAEWPLLNEVYVTFFPSHKPARSAFAGTGLAQGARVEIECWATVDGTTGAVGSRARLAALWREYGEDLMLGDPEALADWFTEGARLLEPGRPDLIGRSAIHSFFVEAFEMATVREVRIDPVDVSGGEGRLWEWGRYEEVVQVDRMEPQRFTGRYTAVWREGSDGEWRIDFLMPSPDPGAAPSP